MKHWALVAVPIAMLAGCCAFCDREYSASVDEGFKSIFNGRDLSGWAGDISSFAVDADGAIEVVANAALANGMRHDLLTDREYGNFVLRFEFMMPTNGDCGVGIRCDPGKDQAYFGMCEVQLLDDGGSNYVGLADYQYSFALFGITGARRDNNGKQIWGKDRYFAGNGSYMRRPGMWNFGEIRVAGGEIETYLNGYEISRVDVTKFRGDGDTPDGRPHPGLQRRRGAIGLLGNSPAVKFRNLRVKELPEDAKLCEVNFSSSRPAGFEPCFTGDPRELTSNWKGVTNVEHFDNPIVRQSATPQKRAAMQALADAEMVKHWHVRNGALFFDGFKGGYSLATRRDYADFELWADWRILSITGDSGLYLRGSPQVQIWDAHNQWHIGSGGLYNNRHNPDKALKIADRQVGDWNRFHVIMRGEKVTVWLNGELVVDDVTLENYWDRTKPIFSSEQLELQCHGDPIEWKNIFIREL